MEGRSVMAYFDPVDVSGSVAWGNLTSNSIRATNKILVDDHDFCSS